MESIEQTFKLKGRKVASHELREYVMGKLFVILRVCLLSMLVTAASKKTIARNYFSRHYQIAGNPLEPLLPISVP